MDDDRFYTYSADGYAVVHCFGPHATVGLDMRPLESADTSWRQKSYPDLYTRGRSEPFAKSERPTRSCVCGRRYRAYAGVTRCQRCLVAEGLR